MPKRARKAGAKVAVAEMVADVVDDAVDALLVLDARA